MRHTNEPPRGEAEPVAVTAPRQSACPGLERIVPALDGGICRIKLAGGRISAPQARQVAAAAAQHASGQLELTNRSNLQIRAVRSGAEAALTAALGAAGLGPKVQGADDIRNLLISPAAGLDPNQQLDAWPLAQDLLALLQRQVDFHRLSPKFSLQLDAGEVLSVRDHSHDLWLSAAPDRRLVFGLASCLGQRPLGSVALADAEGLVVAVLQGFLRGAGGGQTRLRQRLAQQAPEDFLAGLERMPVWQPWTGCLPGGSSGRPPLGDYRQRQPGYRMLLAAAPLARLNSEQLQRLAQLAEQRGNGWLHLSPWQGVLLPWVAEAQVKAVLGELAAIGLLVDSADPLSGLAACAGSQGCGKALSDTKADARRLAACWPREKPLPELHLTGCPRSCAAAHIAPYTLLALGPEHYALYQRAADVPGFGRLVADSVNIEQAVVRLSEWSKGGLPREERHDRLSS